MADPKGFLKYTQRETPQRRPVPLRLLDWNSGRKDFYDAPDWQRVCAAKPYQTNVPAIAACGSKLRNTQINAVNYACESTFETMLLHAPEIEAGHGSIPSVQAGLAQAAQAVDRVYARYNAQVADWRANHREEAR